jgi:outer membrane protein assembly factor BamE (lipoprotein component of BamABCDE complex)
MREHPFRGIFLLLLCASLAGCAAHHSSTLSRDNLQNVLHRGMSQPEVTDAIGAPGVVTKDDKSREVWIYDRVHNPGSTRWFAFWAASSTPKSLTLVITFEPNGTDDHGRERLEVSRFDYQSPIF